MKYRFLLLSFCLLTFWANAQLIPEQGTDSIFVTESAFKANSGIIVATRDTAGHPFADSIGLLTISPADSGLYITNGSKWEKLVRSSELNEALKKVLQKENDLGEINDPDIARKNLKLGSLAIRDSILMNDVIGLSDIISSQDLETVTSKNSYTNHPLSSARYMRVKANSQATFIDLNHTPLTSWNEPVNMADTNIVYTITPVAWAENQSVPSFRMRHPLNTFESEITNNRFLNNDFKILPYQYGWAIEYNGTVECWVGEWSIHRGNAYKDVEGRGNGWGGVLWVGDDLDEGGIRMTARNNPELGISYGEMSVEKFGGLPNGNMHFRLPDLSNMYKWTWGERGDSNTVMTLSPEKLVVENIIETRNLNALAIRADTLQLGKEGNPGFQFNSIMKNLPENSTLNYFAWLQYNTAGYKNFAGSTGYFTRTDVAADHVFFTGAGKPVASLILHGNGNLGLGTSGSEYKLNVVSDEEITAKFSGRVIGANAVDSSEFITLGQLRDSLSSLQKAMKARNASKEAVENAGTTPNTASVIIKEDDGQEGTLSSPGIIYGNYILSADGKSSAVNIPHGLGIKPEWWNVQATNLQAAAILFVEADNINIIVHYQNPPEAGQDNLMYNVSIKPAAGEPVKYL